MPGRSSTRARVRPRIDPDQDYQFWWPDVGGYVEYHGTRKERRGLCVVRALDMNHLRNWQMRVTLASVADQGFGDKEFECLLSDIHEVAILVIDRHYAFCSRWGCLQNVTHKESAMACAFCNRRFVAVCDPYEGEFFDVAEIRKDWPLKVIPYRKYELSHGHYSSRGGSSTE